MDNKPEPIDEICRILGVDTGEEAVKAVSAMQEAVQSFDGIINGLSVATVIMVNGKTLFVQMPPTVQLTHYPPEALESVQEAFIDASVGMRGAIAVSKKRSSQAMEALGEMAKPN